MVQELVDVQHDDDVIECRREAYPVLPSVHLSLVTADFDQAVSVADRYRDVEEIDAVTVVAGGFVLVRDKVNEDLQFTGAREQFVHLVTLHFHLQGAVVAGRGPLDLSVAPSDQTALRRFVAHHAHNLGRVRVLT